MLCAEVTVKLLKTITTSNTRLPLCTFRRWHRIAISIKGDSATLLVDCEIYQTLPLNRRPGSTFNLAGAIVVGSQVSADQYYEVSRKKFNLIFAKLL